MALKSSAAQVPSMLVFRGVAGGRMLVATFESSAEATTYVDAQVAALVARAVRNDDRIRGEALALYEERQRTEWTIETGGAP